MNLPAAQNTTRCKGQDYGSSIVTFQAGEDLLYFIITLLILPLRMIPVLKCNIKCGAIVSIPSIFSFMLQIGFFKT